MKRSAFVVISTVMFYSLTLPQFVGARATKSTVASNEVNACTLLTSQEIQQVQGEAVKQTKPDRPPAAGMTLSQCLFITPTPSKSVSVLLASPTPGNKSGVRKFWQQHFDESREAKHSPKARTAGQESEEEELRDAQTLKGIGDQAFWTSNGKVSVLYVLEGDRFLRVSVGGVGNENERLKRSKMLARAAVTRIARHD